MKLHVRLISNYGCCQGPNYKCISKYIQLLLAPPPSFYKLGFDGFPQVF